MVRQLIGSRKATATVLDFIVAKWAGQRSQKQKQEMRRKKRKRDKNWDLIVDRLEGDEDGGGEGERGKDRENRE